MENNEMVDKKLIGERFKSTRKSLGLTQKELSKKLNIPQPNISLYENGELAPSLNVLIALSQKYDVSVDYLLGLSKWERAADVRELVKKGIGKKETHDDGSVIIEIPLDALEEDVKKNIKPKRLRKANKKD